MPELRRLVPAYGDCSGVQRCRAATSDTTATRLLIVAQGWPTAGRPTLGYTHGLPAVERYGIHQPARRRDRHQPALMFHHWSTSQRCCRLRKCRWKVSPENPDCAMNMSFRAHRNAPARQLTHSAHFTAKNVPVPVARPCLVSLDLSPVATIWALRTCCRILWSWQLQAT